MKNALSIVVAAAFAVTSLGALAQDKKKEEVKSPSGRASRPQTKRAMSRLRLASPRRANGEPLPAPKNIGKRKDEKERMKK